ncbi:TadE family protein [Roseiconus lacunae]|uniref:TadE family protein n=1 Tax=Roseiconus lacunae TaxID=2605694 RepID=UPI0030850818|nr:TadE family protein [Stieleria sp. HD01]
MILHRRPAQRRLAARHGRTICTDRSGRQLRSNERIRSRRPNRRGVATVEFAICLPALIALTIGTIDICSMLFLKESITIAAYEGARMGVGRDRTNGDVSTRVQQFLDERNIQYTGNPCSFGSPDFTSADTLDNVTVTVTVPCDGNLLIPSALFAGMDLSASVTLRKEYRNLIAN